MSNQRFFQWIVGERKGEVVLYDSITEDDGILYIVFKDQTRINEEFVGELNAKSLDKKLMCVVSSPDNIWKFKEKWIGKEEEKWETNDTGEKVCVQPAIAGKKIIDLIPPKPIAPTESKFGVVDKLIKSSNESIQEIKRSVETSLEPEQKTIQSNDPVFIMMDKAKKIDSEVNMTLTIALPSISLFEIVRDSFDNGSEKALDFIIDSIDIKDIKEELKRGIDSMYNDKPEEMVEDNSHDTLELNTL